MICGAQQLHMLKQTIVIGISLTPRGIGSDKKAGL
jgi:hypothetical protein